MNGSKGGRKGKCSSQVACRSTFQAHGTAGVCSHAQRAGSGLRPASRGTSTSAHLRQVHGPVGAVAGVGGGVVPGELFTVRHATIG